MDPKSKECDVLGDAVYNEGENWWKCNQQEIDKEKCESKE
jgi:hypothetical protein